jgi:glycerophosphoryl diester phosphodiesterase
MTASAAAFDLQGHRGARGLAPENTLPAFARALSIGVTTLEMDAGLTEDGVVVIVHDRRLNPDVARGPDGRWLQGRTPAIRELTYRELQRYDVGRIKPGSDYSRRFPEQRRADKVRIPTLEEVFELTRHARNDEVRFNIETKLSPEAPEDTADPETFARALIKVIRDNGMAGRTTIQSFDWRTLAVVQKEAPEIATSYLTSQQQALDNIEAGRREGSSWTAGIRFSEHGSVPKMVKAAGGTIWSPNYVGLTGALVKEAKSLGLAVLPWTVSDRADMERLIDWSVDGIITDYPDRLREVMAAKDLPLPRATPVRP